MKLIIKLLSDTCIGNGTGHGAEVDTDTCYHDNGVPFIPSRRLKGILKETAQDLMDWGIINENQFNALFSTTGLGYEKNNKLIIHDAEIKDYSSIAQEINNSPLYTKERVLNYYTYVRYSTEIVDGIANKESLRSMRVVKQGNIFEAYLYNGDIDVLNTICKAVSHIGMNRNRGYGEVKVEVVEGDETNHVTFPKLQDEKQYMLYLKVHNISPLILTQGNISNSVDYIPGNTVLGYFANQYLTNHDVEDSPFEELFIKGGLCFENGYISNKNYDLYKPSPLSLNKVKDGTTYYNKATDVVIDKNQQLSRVNGKYICDAIQDIKPPSKEVIYHHQRPKDKSYGHVIANGEDTGAFYQLEVLSSNQYFILPVRGKGSNLKVLEEYVNNTMTLGKSKSTQYGKVVIEKIDYKEIEDTPTLKGKLVAELITPVMITNLKTLETTIDMNDLIQAINDATNANAIKEKGKTFVGYTKLSGYNRKWNLPKPISNVFKEGSIILLDVVNPVAEDIFIGESQAEGCGHIHFTPVENIISQSEYDYKEAPQPINTLAQKNTKLYQYIQEQENKEIILNSILDKVANTKVNSNPTTIGRVLLMTKNKDYKQFKTNIKAIKDKDKRKEINTEIEHLETIVSNLGMDEDQYKLYAVVEYFTQCKYKLRKKERK